MKDKFKMSKSELEIMQILWTTNPMTFEEIIETLSLKMNWSRKTIRIFIKKLMKKGAIYNEKNGRSYKYYPLATEEECVKLENQSIFKKAYDGVLNFLYSISFKENDITLKKSTNLKI